MHCHTIASGHAYSTVNEMTLAAARKGLSMVAVTDHAPSLPGSSNLFYFYNLWVLPEKLNGIWLLPGVELNILDKEGKVDLPPSALADLDVVIASLHVPCYEPTTKDEHTSAIINAMKNPHVNVIGHLGDPRFPFDIEAVVQAAIENRVVLEINNASLHPKSFRQGGVETMRQLLLSCKEKEWPVVLGSDAHFMEDVGEFGFVEVLLKDVAMPPHLILNTSMERFKQYVSRLGRKQ